MSYKLAKGIIVKIYCDLINIRWDFQIIFTEYFSGKFIKKHWI